MFKHRDALLLSAAILLTSASPSFAQNAATDDIVDVTTNDTVDVTTDMNGVTTDGRDRDDDDGFDWGLLGLLGLAGLLGMKRREPDLRRDTTTTGTTTDRR